MPTASNVATIAQAGKFLSFRLGSEEYGLEILKVQEIVGVTGMMRVPHVPGYVRGLLALRGRAVPAIDLRHKLGLRPVEDTAKTCVVVAQVGFGGTVLTVGLVVDEVCEVVNIAEDQIGFPPSCCGGMEGVDFVNGQGTLGGRDVILMDADSLFTQEELRVVADLVD